jgi:hypothetical protein
MHLLSNDDVADLLLASKQFKILVPLETLRSMCDNEILTELFENMIDYALRYTESVCRWQRMAMEDPSSFDDRATRQAIEDTRHTVHTAFNDHVNILSRTMVLLGKSTKWRELIGHNRPDLGRFALALSFEYIKQPNKGGVQ